MPSDDGSRESAKSPWGGGGVVYSMLQIVRVRTCMQAFHCDQKLVQQKPARLEVSEELR